jgi:hypothetical protein
MNRPFIHADLAFVASAQLDKPARGRAHQRLAAAW